VYEGETVQALQRFVDANRADGQHGRFTDYALAIFLNTHFPGRVWAGDAEASDAHLRQLKRAALHASHDHEHSAAVGQSNAHQHQHGTESADAVNQSGQVEKEEEEKKSAVPDEKKEMGVSGAAPAPSVLVMDEVHVPGLFAPNFNRVPLIRKLQRFLGAYPEVTHCVLVGQDLSLAEKQPDESHAATEKIDESNVLSVSKGGSDAAEKKSSSTKAATVACSPDKQELIRITETGVWDENTTRGLQMMLNRVHRADQFEQAVKHYQAIKCMSQFGWSHSNPGNINFHCFKFMRFLSVCVFQPRKIIDPVAASGDFEHDSPYSGVLSTARNSCFHHIFAGFIQRFLSILEFACGWETSKKQRKRRSTVAPSELVGCFVNMQRIHTTLSACAKNLPRRKAF
jgi:hypothetical protein